LETLYNIYKHESNVVGKRTLGLGAVENTFHTLINSIETPGGAAMPALFTHNNEIEGQRESLLWLKHNKVTKDGKELISIASRYDVDNVNKIADVISQMMNGCLDVEKDAWVFFIQGNYEVAPLLLYLVKAGVPIEEAIYFVSQPLVREYVKEQRIAKSTYADVLQKKPDSRNFVKYQASSAVLAKYFEPEVVKSLNKNRARYDVGLEMANSIFENRKNKTFSKEEMYKLIKDFKKDPSSASSELSLTMFLHFLQIEAQTTGLTELKMAANLDTSTKTSGSAIEQSEANINSIQFQDKLEDGLFNSIANSSIISSFFNNKLFLALNQAIFPLRYNDKISNYLIAKNAKIRDDSAKTFGENKADLFVNTFRNDIISFLFQTAARTYRLKNTYKSYSLNTTIPVSLADELKFGAFVKEDKAKNKILYVDESALNNDFNRKIFVKGSDQEDSYEKRGLYPLTDAHFHSDGLTNRGEYVKFVAEREYLRSVYSQTDIKKMHNYKTELKIVKELNPGYPPTKLASMTYEKILAIKALENTLNPYHMFKDPMYAYAIQFTQIMNKHGKNLKKEFAVLNKMKNDPNSNRTMFNLYIAEKDFTTDVSNLYYKNLKDLSDPAVLKVSNKNENQMISDFFSRLPLYSFMQTGINKTKFNFTNVVDYNQFMYLVDTESKKLLRALENPQLTNVFLDAFYARFVRENGRVKSDKGRYKNFLFNIDLDNLADIADSGIEDPMNYTEDLEQTKNENIFILKDGNLTLEQYGKAVEANTDITFLYPTSVAVIQDKTFAVGRAFIKNNPSIMSVGFPVSLNSEYDYFSGLKPEQY
ncbi:MAG: hypothetical protein WD512_15375, partial [Candidatus Paceibacterota bacterium]